MLSCLLQGSGGRGGASAAAFDVGGPTSNLGESEMGRCVARQVQWGRRGGWGAAAGGSGGVEAATCQGGASRRLG